MAAPEVRTREPRRVDNVAEVRLAGDRDGSGHAHDDHVRPGDDASIQRIDAEPTRQRVGEPSVADIIDRRVASAELRDTDGIDIDACDVEAGIEER